MNFPEQFEKRMREQLGEEEFRAYEACFSKKVSSAVRVNTLKLSPEEFRTLSPFGLQPVPWTKNGFYYEDSDIPSKHPYYYAGMYYLQEPSAMTPAALLPVEPGDRVLDLCAAPGGKSTELGAKMQGKGILIANDISHSRAKALLKNIELFGIMNAVVTSEPAEKLAQHFPEYFDKILVDAPCSGEGMFRKQPAIMKNWEQYGTGYYNDLQKQILPRAYEMLRPGGMLLYSTCTFSPDEDEDTVRFFLDSYPDMELVDAVPAERKAEFALFGFDKGRVEWMKDPLPEIDKTIRLFPHKVEGEGHYLALFHKKGDSTDTANVPLFRDFAKPKSVTAEVTEFLSRIAMDIPVDRLALSDDWLSLIPEGMPEIKGLRVLRAGLFLGELRKGRFEPSQALAMALLGSSFDSVINYATDDPDVIRYLKCESVDPPEETKDGYVLVCVDGYPLGFGKVRNGQFKNKYLPGWRMM